MMFGFPLPAESIVRRSALLSLAAVVQFILELHEHLVDNVLRDILDLVNRLYLIPSDVAV